MPDDQELIWEPGALDDLIRLREFIEIHNPSAAAKAARSIIDAANSLLANPLIGRPIETLPEFRQLVIPFGKRGYVMNYRTDGQRIVILRVWHGLEDRDER